MQGRRGCGAMAGLAAMALLAGAVPAQAGLIAYYNFDELGGTTAYDSVGSANGTLQGGAMFVPGAGVSGGALSLNKLTGDYVTMGHNFDFTTPFTIAVWIQLAPGDTSYEVPVARHTATVVAGYYLGINDIGDGCSAVNQAHFYTGYPCSGNSGVSVNDGQWHQLVGTYSGGVSSIYVDGVLRSTSGGGSPLTSVGSDFLVGGITFGGVPGGVFTGLVDELRIFDTALSAGEVAALYSGAVPEPGALWMALTGVVGLVVLGRRRFGRG